MESPEPLATKTEICDEQLVVHLKDGRTVSVPLTFYPRLAHATPAERQHCEIFGEGSAIEWPDVDEHLSRLLN